MLGGDGDECWQLAWEAPDAPGATWTEADFRAAAEAVCAGQPLPEPSPRAPDPWAQYHPRFAWLTVDPSGPHGIGHLVRVLVWSNYAAR